jgi:hypothetical protein
MVSAVTQNQPVRVEIKGFKTGHYLGVKTALVGPIPAGSEGHVECPESEPGDDDIQFSRSRMLSAPDCTRTSDQSIACGSVFALSRGKTSYFDDRQGSLCEGVRLNIWPTNRLSYLLRQFGGPPLLPSYSSAGETREGVQRSHQSL